MSFQDPLPVVDANAILQRQSIGALQSALPATDFIFRDERVDDYGVDGSLEILINGKATNVAHKFSSRGAPTRPSTRMVRRCA